MRPIRVIAAVDDDVGQQLAVAGELARIKGFSLLNPRKKAAKRREDYA